MPGEAITTFVWFCFHYPAATVNFSKDGDVILGVFCVGAVIALSAAS